MFIIIFKPKNNVYTSSNAKFSNFDLNLSKSVSLFGFV
jgi:hypothetical protein